MSDGDEKPSITRRDWLLLTGATSASMLAGCDAAPTADAGIGPGMDAGAPPPDAGPPRMPVPPRARTYETFEHGVASGDPLADAVILWTRITTGQPEDPPPASVDVTWTIATDRALSDVVTSGTVTTDATRDWTVKVDVTGLSAGTTYYYRFSSGGTDSPIGRTRTAPTGSVERLRFGLVSCSSLGHGYFHAYQQISQRADLDAVIHLGDYIYEYSSRDYGSRREYLPAHEIVTLADYRERYGQYRREPDLSEAHRQHAFITIWDDHETANNSWSGGAENHDPSSEGAWADRLAAATQAYHEWMPMRDGADPTVLWRGFRYGELCELLVLDTRIYGRDKQAAGFSDPSISEIDRQLLGEVQETWLFDSLRDSTARWKVVAQQVMMGAVDGLGNVDQWEGYPAARTRFLETLVREAVDDVVVLTGDIHSSWAFELPFDQTDEAYDPLTGVGSHAVEFVVPAVSSPGLPDALAESIDFVINGNPALRWAQVSRRGYVVLDLDASRAQADWFYVGDVEEEGDTTDEHGASWATSTRTSHLVEFDTPAPPKSDPPALA